MPQCPLCDVSYAKVARHLRQRHGVASNVTLVLLYGEPFGGPLEEIATKERLRAGNGQMRRLAVSPGLGLSIVEYVS